VRERVIAARAADLAKKEGQDKLAAWKAAPASATLPAAVVLSRDQAQNVPQPLLLAALRANTSTLPAWVGVDLGAQGYAVVKVNSIVPRPAPEAAVAKRDREQYAKWWTNAENQAYYELLKERFKAQILAPSPAKLSKDAAISADK
jgi:peptidyl-prolyl cis-trans isomerase D